MAGVQWIRLNTDMFDNAKIKYIRTLPSGNDLVVIWVMLLAKAGKCNSNGFIFLTENIPYTADMLAAEFDFEVSTINLALNTFASLGMIQLEDSKILITNWEEHQNIEGLDKIREQTRKRVARHREKLALENSNVTCNVTVTQSNATEKNKNRKEIDIDIDNNNMSSNSTTYKEIIDYLNSKAKTNYKYTTKKTQSCINTRLAEGFTVEDFKTVIDNKCKEWLNTEYSKFLRPETLFGNKFEGYLNQKPSGTNKKDSKFFNFESHDYDYDDLEKKLLGW